MEIDPADDDVATPHTAHSSAIHSVHENTSTRDVERERGRERKALGGLTAAQASSDNRHPHPQHHSLSHFQPLPLPTSAPAPVRATNVVSTSTSRSTRAVSESSSVRSTVEDRSSNATFSIFSDNAGKMEKKEECVPKSVEKKRKETR